MEDKSLNRRDWIWALVAALGAVLARVPFLSWRDFWCDEYFTLNAARMSVPDMVANRLGQGHSPLYFFYARLGLLFGTQEWQLRLTSLVALAAAVLLLTGLAGTLKLRRYLVPLWCMAIFQPDWMTNGTMYRYMMVLVAVAIGALWACAAYLERPNVIRGLVLALACGVLLWIHGSAQFFVASLLVFMAWDLRRNRGGRPWRQVAFGLWPVLAGLLSSLPLLYLLSGRKSLYKAGLANLAGLFENLLEVSFGDYRMWPRLLDFSPYASLTLQCAVLAAALVLMRRELLRHGLDRAGRMVITLTAGLPVAMILFGLLAKNYQGPVRYLAAFSIPSVMCLAIAWRSPTPWARHYRWGLALLLAVQFSASAIDRGDRFGEAIRWVMEQHSDDTPILGTMERANAIALRYRGFEHPKLLKGISGYAVYKQCRWEFRKELKGESRAFYILYYWRAPVFTVLKDLTDEGFIVDERHWRLSRRVTVGALIRKEEERGWLMSLDKPKKLWGPSREDR